MINIQHFFLKSPIETNNTYFLSFIDSRRKKKKEIYEIKRGARCGMWMEKGMGKKNKKAIKGRHNLCTLYDCMEIA